MTLLGKITCSLTVYDALPAEGNEPREGGRQLEGMGVLPPVARVLRHGAATVPGLFLNYSNVKLHFGREI